MTPTTTLYNSNELEPFFFNHEFLSLFDRSRMLPVFMCEHKRISLGSCCRFMVSTKNNRGAIATTILFRRSDNKNGEHLIIQHLKIYVKSIILLWYSSK